MQNFAPIRSGFSVVWSKKKKEPSNISVKEPAGCSLALVSLQHPRVTRDDYSPAVNSSAAHVGVKPGHSIRSKEG